MPATTVRIDEAGRRALVELRRQTGQTTPVILRAALEAYRRERFFDRLDDDFARLRSDPAASADYDAERDAIEQATVADGLDDGTA